MRECSSPQTCHVSCHMSRVTCNFFLFIFFFFGQSGEAYRWRVCYQRGLPRLVLMKQSHGPKVSGCPECPYMVASQIHIQYMRGVKTNGSFLFLVCEEHLFLVVLKYPIGEIGEINQSKIFHLIVKSLKGQ